jgi:integrase
MTPSTLLRAEVWRIPVESRGLLAISQIQGPDGDVRDLSSYEDMRWDFRPYIATVNVQRRDGIIDFAAALPSGARLSEPEHVDLLQATKALIYVRWMFPAVKSGKRLKARTVIGEWKSLGLLLNWMIENGVQRFQDITAEVAQKFVSWLIDRRNRNGYSIRNGLKPAALIDTMYHSRSMLPDAPREHPWPDSGVSIELGVRRSDLTLLGATTEIIPRRLLIKLGAYAQKLVAEDVQPVLEAWTSIWQEVDRIVDEMRHEEELQKDLRWGRVNHQSCSKKERMLYKEFGSRLPPIARAHGYADIDSLLVDVHNLTAACYALCGVFSGMRDSELAALKHGCFKRTIEPDGEEYCWLEGLVFKTEEDPRPGRWMVPPVVERAVRRAEAISAPLVRRGARLLELLQADYSVSEDESKRSKIAMEIEGLRKLDNCLFLRTHTSNLLPSSPTNSSTNAWLKDLAADAELTLELDDMGEVRDRVRLTPGVVWPLATHQFRRTFAVFVARNLLGDVRYLRHHFKHWSIDMSLHYASDPTLDDSVFETVSSMRDELQAEVVAGWIVGDQKVAGGRAPQVVQFRSRNTVKTVKDARDLARSLGDGIYVRGTGHSWCLTETEGCGGEGLYDAIRCVGCGESLIDESHVPVWQAIRDQQIELLDSPDLGVPAKTRVQRHLDAADAVLRDLAGSGGSAR